MEILRRNLISILALVLIFFFRLAFGLCSDFRADVGDERQIYLIGLKYYTTGQWPYFGPDVTNTIQIPGALQGLVVGLPFFVLPIPEAPYILLNILSFLSLCFFAWYCTKRLPICQSEPGAGAFYHFSHLCGYSSTHHTAYPLVLKKLPE